MLERIKLVNSTLITKNSNFIKLILKKLEEYENKKLGQATFVHGDPVFSNIIKNTSDNIKFIDPRGGYLSKFSIFGDKFYDYSKVYQSLLGYHQIINNKSLNNTYVAELKQYYEKLIINTFGVERLKHIKVITSSLYVSLIPLHHQKHQEQMLYVAKKIVRSI